MVSLLIPTAEHQQWNTEKSPALQARPLEVAPERNLEQKSSRPPASFFDLLPSRRIPPLEFSQEVREPLGKRFALFTLVERPKLLANSRSHSCAQLPSFGGLSSHGNSRAGYSSCLVNRSRVTPRLRCL